MPFLDTSTNHVSTLTHVLHSDEFLDEDADLQVFQENPEVIPDLDYPMQSTEYSSPYSNEESLANGAQIQESDLSDEELVTGLVKAQLCMGTYDISSSIDDDEVEASSGQPTRDKSDAPGCIIESSGEWPPATIVRVKRYLENQQEHVSPLKRPLEPESEAENTPEPAKPKSTSKLASWVRPGLDLFPSDAAPKLLGPGDAYEIVGREANTRGSVYLLRAISKSAQAKRAKIKETSRQLLRRERIDRLSRLCQDPLAELTGPDEIILTSDDNSDEQEPDMDEKDLLKVKLSSILDYVSPLALEYFENGMYLNPEKEPAALEIDEDKAYELYQEQEELENQQEEAERAEKAFRMRQSREETEMEAFVNQQGALLKQGSTRRPRNRAIEVALESNSTSAAGSRSQSVASVTLSAREEEARRASERASRNARRQSMREPVQSALEEAPTKPRRSRTRRSSPEEVTEIVSLLSIQSSDPPSRVSPTTVPQTKIEVRLPSTPITMTKESNSMLANKTSTVKSRLSVVPTTQTSLRSFFTLSKPLVAEKETRSILSNSNQSLAVDRTTSPSVTVLSKKKTRFSIVVPATPKLGNGSACGSARPTPLRSSEGFADSTLRDRSPAGSSSPTPSPSRISVENCNVGPVDGFQSPGDDRDIENAEMEDVQSERSVSPNPPPEPPSSSYAPSDAQPMEQDETDHEVSRIPSEDAQLSDSSPAPPKSSNWNPSLLQPTSGSLRPDSVEGPVVVGLEGPRDSSAVSSRAQRLRQSLAAIAQTVPSELRSEVTSMGTSTIRKPTPNNLYKDPLNDRDYQDDSLDSDSVQADLASFQHSTSSTLQDTTKDYHGTLKEKTGLHITSPSKHSHAVLQSDAFKVLDRPLAQTNRVRGHTQPALAAPFQIQERPPLRRPTRQSPVSLSQEPSSSERSHSVRFDRDPTPEVAAFTSPSPARQIEQPRSGSSYGHQIPVAPMSSGRYSPILFPVERRSPTPDRGRAHPAQPAASVSTSSHHGLERLSTPECESPTFPISLTDFAATPSLPRPSQPTRPAREPAAPTTHRHAAPPAPPPPPPTNWFAAEEKSADDEAIRLSRMRAKRISLAASAGSTTPSQKMAPRRAAGSARKSAPTPRKTPTRRRLPKASTSSAKPFLPYGPPMEVPRYIIGIIDHRDVEGGSPLVNRSPRLDEGHSRDLAFKMAWGVLGKSCLRTIPEFLEANVVPGPGTHEEPPFASADWIAISDMQAVVREIYKTGNDEALVKARKLAREYWERREAEEREKEEREIEEREMEEKAREWEWEKEE